MYIVYVPLGEMSRSNSLFSGVSGKNRADKLAVTLDDPQVTEILGERLKEMDRIAAKFNNRA